MRPLHVVVVAALVAAALRTAGCAGPPPTEPTEPASATRESGRPPVLVVDVDGAIGPPMARLLSDAIEQAQERGAAALVLRIDTPGGLDSSMREMARDIIASPVPVVAWVAPSGARAASAGTFLVYASHVAAMAPATSLGAATPVSIGGGPLAPAPKDGPDDVERGPEDKQASEQKAINDATAMIRGLAELRGRDPGFAEAAVREAASLSSSEALARGVVEVIANDRAELLRALDGRTVQVAGDPLTLDVADAPVVELEAGLQHRILSVLANPNVAYLLLMFGFYGILFELSNPGGGVAGIAGAIALMLALFSLQLLPINYAGVALVLLGFALMIAEAFTATGALGVGGVISLLVGSLLLIDLEAPELVVSRPLIAVVGVVSAVFLLAVVRLGWRARRRPIVSGREQLIGSVAVARAGFAERGPVLVESEVWTAITDAPLREGQAAVVVDVDGLVLHVRPRPDGDAVSAATPELRGAP